MSKLILVEKMERVCLLTLNAPDKLNALSEEMIENLSGEFEVSRTGLKYKRDYFYKEQERHSVLDMI